MGAAAPAASAKANPRSTVASPKYMESATSRLTLAMAAAAAEAPAPPWPQSCCGAQNLESSVWFPAVLVFSVAFSLLNILQIVHYHLCSSVSSHDITI